MVTLLDIAKRAGVSREAVRLWAAGQRGPGSFPRPVLVTTGGESLWDWQQVAPWIERHQGRVSFNIVDVYYPATARILLTADRVLSPPAPLRSPPHHPLPPQSDRLLEPP